MKSAKILAILVLALGLVVWLVGPAEAEPMGTAFTYQGRLLDDNDTAQGVYDMMFQLYDSPEGPSEIGVTDVQDVEIPDGYFTVELNFGSEVFSGDWRWLEISIRPGDSNDPDGYVTLNPRQQVTPTPYALYALRAGVEIPFILTADIPGDAVILGINEGAGYGLGGNSLTGHGVRGNSISGYGVLGTNTGGNYGYLGSSDHGVYGQHAGSGNKGYLGGSNYGVCGSSSSGDGVYGTSTSGRGVYGFSSNGYGVHGEGFCGVYGYNITSGNFGVLGGSNDGVYGSSASGHGVYGFSSSGYGVYGYAISSGSYSNYGGYFVAAGGDGRGVYGYASNSGSNYNYGGYFEAAGGNGHGVYGYASNTGAVSNYGGYFKAASKYGTGVYGYASNNGNYYNYGGYFEAAGGDGRGVYGYASNTGAVSNYGGYFRSDGISGRGVYAYAGGMFGIGVEGWGVKFDFFAAGPATDYGSTSSIRWKNDIRPIDEPLEKIMSLRGVYFNWDEEHGGEHDVGMIAEEVGEVLPEIVQYEEDGIYTIGMDYSKLTPLLVEAVKELKTDLDELQKQHKEKDVQIVAQQKQIEELQEEVGQLKQLVKTVTELK